MRLGADFRALPIRSNPAFRVLIMALSLIELFSNTALESVLPSLIGSPVRLRNARKPKAFAPRISPHSAAVFLSLIASVQISGVCRAFCKAMLLSTEEGLKRASGESVQTKLSKSAQDCSSSMVFRSSTCAPTSGVSSKLRKLSPLSSLLNALSIFLSKCAPSIGSPCVLLQ